MRKTLRNLALATTLLVCGASSWAADLVQKNAFAYDIRVDKSEVRKPVVTYKLNGLASAVTVKALVDGEVIATAKGTTDETNTVIVDIPEAAFGDIKFEVDVTTQKTVTTPTKLSTSYSFYTPMGVAVNNSTESPTFGQIIVSEFNAHANSTRHSSTGGGGRGNALYAFDPQLQPIKNTQANGAYGFSGGLDMATQGEFARVRFSNDGRLFMYSYDAKEGCGVYEFKTNGVNAGDANQLNTQATKAISVTKPTAGNRAADSNTTFDVWGSGNDLRIGLLQLGKTDATYGSVTLHLYDFGTKTTWTGNPTATLASVYLNSNGTFLNTVIRTQYINCGWDADGNGFNVIHRVTDPKSTDEAIIHFNTADLAATSKSDWQSSSNYPSYFKDVVAAAYNADGTLLATYKNTKDLTTDTTYPCTIYKVSKNAQGVPQYSVYATFKDSGATGTDLAFDYANNLYLVNRSGEYVHCWQLPHLTGGVVTVPAPSSQGYYLEKIETPKLYVIGEFQDWDIENPVELEQDLQGEYVYTFPNVANKGAEKGFKLSFAKGSWEAFNAGAIGYSNDGCTILGGHSQQLYANDNNNNTGNLAAPCAGDWTITVNEDNLLTLTGKPTDLPQYIYVKGDMTDWEGDENYKIVFEGNFASPVMTDNGEYKYTATFNDFSGDFKISGNLYDWDGINYGPKGGNTNVTLGTTMEATYGSLGNFVLGNQIFAGAKIDFYYNPVQGKSSWMNFSGKARNHYAYNLEHYLTDDGNSRTFVFKSTGAADKAIIHFTRRSEDEPLRALANEDDNIDFDEVDDWGNSINNRKYEVSDIQKGENVVVIPITFFPKYNYNWSVEIPATINEDVVTDAINVGGGRAAVACFTDPNYPNVYGYTVIGRSSNTGIDIYDASGKKVASELFANNSVMGGVDPGMAESTATPSDATTQGNRVLFSNQATSANGVVGLDIDQVLNGVTEPYAVYNANDIRTVGILGNGDETNMVVFNKKINTYGQLQYNNIGTKKITNNTFTTLDAVTTTQLQNARVFVASTDKGFFFSQHRGDGMGTSGLNGLGFVSFPDYKYVWNISTYKADYPTMLPTSTGGVAVNHEQNLLAVSTYTGIYLFDLSFNEDGTPNIGTAAKKIISYPFGGGASVSTAMDMKFDAVGNLHVISQTYGYFRVLFAKTETAAPEVMAITDGITSGVEGITPETIVEGDAVYYNLNGVRIESDRLTPGVYVKVVGGKSTKVVVR